MYATGRKRKSTLDKVYVFLYLSVRLSQISEMVIAKSTTFGMWTPEILTSLF